MSHDASIFEQAFAAAKANPDLTIRCPRCAEGVFGRDYPAHEIVCAVPSAKSGMTAIILAGGKGTRLAPWPAPKCLLPINGVTILDRLLKHLFDGAIVSEGVVCGGYRGNDVFASLMAHGRIKSNGLGVSFSNAGEDVPMGVRLLKAREFAGEGRVLIVYADDLADVNITKLLARHEAKAPQTPGFVPALMTFTAAYANAPGGTINIDVDGGIHIVDEERRVINIGFVVVEPEAWSMLLPEDGLSDWINRVSGEHGRVRIYYHDGKRATVNTLADLKTAEEVWR